MRSSVRVLVLELKECVCILGIRFWTSLRSFARPSAVFLLAFGRLFRLSLFTLSSSKAFCADLLAEEHLVSPPEKQLFRSSWKRQGHQWARGQPARTYCDQ